MSQNVARSRVTIDACRLRSSSATRLSSWPTRPSTVGRWSTTRPFLPRSEWHGGLNGLPTWRLMFVKGDQAIGYEWSG